MAEPRYRLAVALSAVVALSWASGACDSSHTVSAPEVDGGLSSTPSPSSPQTHEDSGAPVCYAKSCPSGYGDCPGSKYKCGTDLSSDPENCGSCGNSCPTEPFYAQINVQWACVQGRCERRAASTAWADCDQLIENGYETNITCDPDNCGACGNACAPGQPCVNGVCGCQPGRVNCGSTACASSAGANCKNLLTDASNCGACGKRCKPPPGAPALDFPETWVCDDGKDECARGCYTGFDHCSDDPEERCETNTYGDPNHCGGCGNKCEPGQTCVSGKCQCPPGSAMCAGTCVALDADPRNCGACYNVCPGPVAGGHGFPICNDGQCGFQCAAQYADCNGALVDGCEAHLRFDPNHCGACNVQCEPGTPCIEGACATIPCPEDPTR